MQIAIAGLYHETNSFLPPVTVPRAWTADCDEDWKPDAVAQLRSVAIPELELTVLLLHRFPRSGPLRDSFFRELLDDLKMRLDVTGPVDALFVQLHGAMATDEDDEADAAILIELRSCLPPGAPLVATVVRRANLSPLLVSSCDLLIGPSTGEPDHAEPATARAARILKRMLCDELRPTMALARPPILPDAAEPDHNGPWDQILAPLVDEALAVAGVLDVTLTAGSATTDQPRTGMGVLVVTDSDPELAADVAADLAEEIWHLREPLTVCRRNAELRDAYEWRYENVRRPLYPLDLW
jgi:microcystin degradation protein MlrC